MFNLLRCQSTRLATRCYSTPQPAKASVKLIAELRKITEVSISKAREALAATDNDVKAALEWLQKDLAASGAKKALKVQGRSTNQGLISIATLSNGVGMNTGSGYGSLRAAMVELNCETDFVGRNELFGRLAADIAYSAAFFTNASGSAFQPLSVEDFRNAPLLNKASLSAEATGTVGEAIRDTIAKVGENITLRRVIAVVESKPKEDNIAFRLASYVHGTVNDPAQGRIGSLALLALKSRKIPELTPTQAFHDDLQSLGRSVARQIVGFDTRTIHGDGDDALYNQPFMMLAGDSSSPPVRDALVNWSKEKGLIADTSEGEGAAVLDFAKWTVGEPIKDISDSQN